MWKDTSPKLESFIVLGETKLLPCNCKMMVVTNSALHAFEFMLDGDVKLQAPDFMVHEQDLTNAVDAEGSEEEL